MRISRLKPNYNEDLLFPINIYLMQKLKLFNILSREINFYVIVLQREWKIIS